MPELPEVETIKNDLNKKMAGTGISAVKVGLPRAVRNPLPLFRRVLKGNAVRRVRRVGKLMVFELAETDYRLLVHLKMTGQLVYRKNGDILAGGHSQDSPINDLPNKYTRVTMEFTDGSTLFFNDMRTFGYLKVVRPDEFEEVRSGFGPDALESGLTFDDFYDKVKGRAPAIKAVLLNQAVIAGIGNIYADEILFQAGVRPDRRAASLRKPEAERIFRAIRPVLKKAIKYRGTTFNDYVDSDGHKGGFLDYLRVYGRAGEKCRQCKNGIIKKIKVAGRGTCYCPRCQR